MALSSVSLFVSLALTCSTLPLSAEVTDWFFEKAVNYEQTADNTTPGAPVSWTVQIYVETANPGDANSVTIASLGGSHSFEYEDGEWFIVENFASKAAMDAAFPSNTLYTITLSGGSLGTRIQTFTLGAPNYPNAPYFTGLDFTAAQSIRKDAGFTFHWNSPGAFGNGIEFDIDDPITESEIFEMETYEAPLPTSVHVPASLLEAGNAYTGYLFFPNANEVSGAGGFGPEGVVQHSTLLKFSLQTVITPTPQSIVGAWHFGDGAANGSGVLVFQANGVYFHIEDGENDPEGPDGVEIGTYVWNEDGSFTATPIVDTNGEIGLSHPIGTTSAEVDGNILNFTVSGEGTFPLTRVGFLPARPEVGAWRLCDNSGSNTAVLVFLENGTYFHGEENDGDPSGTDGMERGTYTFNPATGALIATPQVDTNGEIGLSHPIPSYKLTLIGTVAVRIDEGEDAYFAHRITNARVFEDWRLNKARGFNQTVVDTEPSALFWDVYAEVETQNATDAASITLSGGNLPAPVPLSPEDEVEWTWDKDYNSQAQIDAEFPDNQTYTFTVTGGELGTVIQQINIGDAAYPATPYLTGGDLTNIQNIDSTANFEVNFNQPMFSSVNLVLTSEPDEDGEEYFDFFIFGGGEHEIDIPADTLDPGITGFGYLEFANGSTTSNGLGGFGISGFSGRQSITFDFPIGTASGAPTLSDALTDAGLTGADAEPTATPFNDGVDNLLKFAFNMNLSGPDSSTLTPGTGTGGLPSAVLDNTGPTTVLRVEFIRRINSGLTYTAQRSSGLDNFAPMTGTVEATPIGNGFERVTVSEPCDPAVVRKCFTRVHVEAP